MYLPVSQIRAVDKYAIDVLGIPSLILMENAGKNAAAVIHNEYPDRKCFLVICGKGNNAGDGFVIARQLLIAGKEVDILLLDKSDDFSVDAKVNYDICKKLNINTYFIDEISSLSQYDVYIDAVYGVGFRGTLPAKIKSVFKVVNHIDGIKISIDIPSGMEADSGNCDQNVFKADLTITMFAKKQAFFSKDVKGIIGKVIVVDIGVPENVTEMIEYGSDIYNYC